MTRAIYYDTETTGINADKDHIIEIAAYDPETKKTYEQLINPGCPIPPEVTAIHHISDEMVADAPDFSEVGKAFAEFCEGDTILIAHNNDSFDQRFLENAFAQHQIPLPNWRYLDTLKWARRYRPDLPKHSLQFLREIYGFPANNAHRALDDVIVLHQVFSALLDDLTISQAWDLLNQPRQIKHMPFGKYQGRLLEKVPSDYYTWLHNSGALDKSNNQELKESLLELGLLSK